MVKIRNTKPSIMKNYLNKWVYGDDISFDVDYDDIAECGAAGADLSEVFERVLIYLYINDREEAFLRFSKENLIDHILLDLDDENKLRWGLKIKFEQYKDLVVTGDEIYLQLATLSKKSLEFATQGKRSHSKVPLACITMYSSDIIDALG